LLVFEKSANFFAEKCRKSQKIVILTSTPGHSAGRKKVMLTGRKTGATFLLNRTMKSEGKIKRKYR
jgi:hypothetical protein